MGRLHTNDPDFDPLADEFDGDTAGKANVKRDDEFARMMESAGSQVFERLKTGEKVEGTVLTIGETEIFLDVGQRAEGVVSVSEFSPEERQALKPGSKLTLYIASTKGGSIELTKSLSSRQTTVDSLQSAFETGIPVEGKVSGENKGGYIVDLPGLKGFVPFSQINIGPRQPSSEYIGKTFQFRVMRITGREAVLSRTEILREAQESERAKILESLVVGQVTTAKVVGIESFGVFVDISGGLTALVPQSEVSWRRVLNSREVVTIGDQVHVKIIRIENPPGTVKPRIAASIKQAEGDPFSVEVDKLAVNQTVEGTVTRLMAFGAFVEIALGVEGLLHISEMSAKRRVIQPGEIVKVGDKIPVLITAIDRVGRRLSLSMKALQDDVLDNDTKAKYLKQKEAENEHRGVEYSAPQGGASAFMDAFSRAQQKPKPRK